MTQKETLEGFGKILMSEVRDESIEQYEMIVAGKLKSPRALAQHKKLSTFNSEQKCVIRDTVVDTVDGVLHFFLWMLEQHEDDIDLNFGECNPAQKENIRDISDGLAGELYTEDGWIAKFSSYKENFGL